jgi:hypothetical protein
MPFPQQTPRLYSKAGIEAIAPDQMGCYGILSGSAMVYIGKGDIRGRMLDHLNGDNVRIARCSPTTWVSVVTSNMDRLERDLIREYDPVCNRRVG